MSEALTVIAALERTARKFPHKRAVVVNDRTCTYAGLLDRADRLAAGLRNVGVRKGSKVALLMGNRVEFAETYFGALKTGATLVVLNARLKGTELTALMRKSKARWLIFADTLVGAVDAIDLNLRQELTLVTVGESGAPGALAYESLLSVMPGQGVRVDVSEADDACILFTSGTTGLPKGAVLAHRNIFFQAINHIVEWDVRFDDVEIYPAPLYHGGGLATLARTVLAGSTLVLMESFEAQDFVTTLERVQATRAVLVPTMCSMILDLPQPLCTSATSLRLIVTGGAIMPVDLKRRHLERLPGVGLCDSYGQTESTGSVACLKPADALRKPGSVGRAFFLNDIRLVDDADVEVAAGEIGEIVVRGPTVMRGYLGEPEATAETLRAGWLHTGDLARQDEDGFLYIIGRKKDMIISGGVNIYPLEIEDVLCAHPAVLEAAVIGVPDPVWGESVKAVVVPKPGIKPSAGELIAFCRKRLAGFKKPRSVEIVDALPKNSLGKIAKSELRRQFGSMLVRDA
ncbi:MAG: hypothetical protein ABS56_04800 [Lautropia sp. SCN 69-89]|nr:MAG: hypothetical protein ABS56_04800 [Lautropia sp. SCN 69-89]